MVFASRLAILALQEMAAVAGRAVVVLLSAAARWWPSEQFIQPQIIPMSGWNMVNDGVKDGLRMGYTNDLWMIG